MTTIKKTKKKNGIQSIEIGFRIIQILMDSTTPLSLKDISQQSKMTPSKVHSYLASFINVGLIEQNEGNSFYRLGHYALKMGLTYFKQFNILSVAQPVMHEIAKKLGHTIFLGIWGNKGPCIIFRVDGSNSQAFLELRIGSVLPILSSALGTNFAAHLPKKIAERFIKDELKLRSMQEKFKNEKEVFLYLDKIKSQGYAIANQTLYKDFSAISVPIFDYANQITAGLTLMGISDIFDPKSQEKIIQILKEKALRISIELGYQQIPN